MYLIPPRVGEDSSGQYKQIDSIQLFREGIEPFWEDPKIENKWEHFLCLGEARRALF